MAEEPPLLPYSQGVQNCSRRRGRAFVASLGPFAGGSWVILAPAVELLGAKEEMPVCLLCGWTSCRVAFGDTGIPKGSPPPQPPTLGGGRGALMGR